MNARLRQITEGASRKELRGRLRRLEGVTVRHAHKFIVGRWKNLQEVRRLAGAWLLAIAALIVAVIWQGNQFASLYTTAVPARDTTYTEGVMGAVDNLNPIFASTPAEKAISRLVFASLFHLDDRNHPQPELVSQYTVDATGKVYTMSLRRDARWQDGVPITAKDVVYTFSTIKDVDARSQLYSSWRNIAVEQVDDYTVRFTLPASFAPFLSSLNVGILPEHILGKVRAPELRSNGFSRNPETGSGPFVFRDVRTVGTDNSQSIIRMDSSPDYFLGAPKLAHFQLHAYSTRDGLVNAFRTQEVAAISDESNDQLEDLDNQKSTVRTDSPLFNAVYAFLKTSSPTLQDQRVRSALELATDQKAILKKLHNRVDPVTGPLLEGQIGYAANLKQPEPNILHAAQLLDAAGWKAAADGKRYRDGQPLKLQLATLSSGDFPLVAQTLMDQWAKLGVTFDSQVIKPDDFQQNIIIPRSYDVLVYELAIGSDPDVFAYWHSSQATEKGFNLSDYKSPKTDDALDTARAGIDIALREAKYRTFTQRWLADVPAIGLYRPSLAYIQTKGTTSFAQRFLSDPADRYYDVRYWSASKVDLRPTL